MFDLISEAAWQTGRAPRWPRTETCKRSEDAMDSSSVPTFLACGGFFVLSFVTIWAFWFVERLRGASAPHV